MAQHVKLQFFMNLDSKSSAKAWMDGVLAGLALYSDDLLDRNVGEAAGVDVSLEDYDEGAFISLKGSAKHAPDAYVVPVELLLNFLSDGLAIDWVNETFREMQRSFTDGSPMIDYAIGDITVSSTENFRM